MKLLILDFLRRWWWAIAVTVCIAAASTLGGQPVALAPVAIFLVIFDTQRGAFRATRPLPVSRRRQALSWWTIAVPLVPFLCAAAMIPLALIRPVLFNNAASEWFSLAVQVYVALGYAALCFIVALALPIRPAERWHEHLLQGIAGGLWGLSMPGMIFVLPNLPKSADQVLPWHWAIFTLALLAIPISFASAARMLDHRSSPLAVKAVPSPSPDAGIDRGWTGIPMYLLQVPGRVVMMLGAMFAIMWIFTEFLLGSRRGDTGSIPAMQLVMFSILITAFTSEWVGLRTLRTLPFSRGMLTALLLSSCASAGLLVGIVMAISAPSTSGRMPSPIEFAVAAAGFGAFLLAVSLYLPGPGRIAAIFVVCVVPAVTIVFPPLAELLLWSGVLAGVAGTFLVYRGIRYSSAFYQPRRMFGMTIGQAQ